MQISSGFIILGFLMILAGAILIYFSLKAGPSEILENRNGVRYFGSIPIIVNGGRKWILAALIISSVIIVYLVAKSVYPVLLGGVLSG